MTACAACSAALADPLNCGALSAGCVECQARLLARRPEHFDATAAAAFTPAYRSALQSVFGDAWMQGHERVRAWSKRAEAARMSAGGAGDDV